MWGKSVWYEFNDLLPTFLDMATLPPTITCWITASQMGHKHDAVGSRFHRKLQSYWEEQQRQDQPIPPKVQTRLDERA